MYYPRFTNVIIHYFVTQDKTFSWRNKIRMHTSRDDYLINTLTFVSAKEATQIYGAILPESLTSLEMKETKAYKTYLGFATGATPPKKARKFKKPTSPQLTTVPQKGVVIRETPEMPLSKKKEKINVEKRKGIDLLSEVALTEEAHKDESWGNDKDDSNNEQDSSGKDSDQENDSDDDKTQSDNENESDSEHESDENESDSESNHQENEEEDDNEEVKDELVKTPSNDFDDKANITNKYKGEKNRKMIILPVSYTMM
ncbi:hypothetical protein Tco_0878144 [Tanacetum coccineum]|uniref:Uncharacterized protein n=1 Tax=Tanacetum coccineum TaxID=301880 RepID=A0ABQ5C0A5_9ASTR